MLTDTSDSNEKNPFDTFLCNEKNAFPLATITEIANSNPGEAYNPFTVCGPVGVGKSHLLQTLSTVFKQKSLTGQIIYSNAARFCTENTHWAMRPEIFWRQCSALLLDDLQEITEQKKYQHILTVLLESCPNYTEGQGRQIAIACSGRADILKLLEERLCPRLECGIVMELTEPDMEVRLRYTRALCKQKKINLSRDQCLFLAQRCAGFRLLQGFLLKIKAFISIHKKNPTVADMENIIHTGGIYKPINCQKILNKVAHAFNLRADDILSEKRRPDIVTARQTAMYLCRQKLHLSYEEIGQAFEGRDHSTVIYAVNKIKRIIPANKDVNKIVTEMEQSLQ